MNNVNNFVQKLIFNKYTVSGVFLILFGIFCLVVYFALIPAPCKVEYRYLPPDLQSLMDNSLSAKDAFEVMEDDEGPWIKAYARQKMSGY